MEKIKYIEMMGKFSLIILLDIKMPGRDGFDALKMIRENEKTCHLPVVLLSSTSSAEDIWKSYRMGANSFISKKINFDDLISDMISFKEYWLGTVKKP